MSNNNPASHPGLRDKIAFITGGGGVLCASMAEALAAQGVKVALFNRTLAKAEAVSQRIQAAGGSALAIAGNVLDEASLQAARDQVSQAWGPVDILINGAGGNNPLATTDNETCADPATKGFYDMDPEAFRGVFDLNFSGSLLPVRVFGPQLEQTRGTIINISSMGSYSPMTKVPGYCAAKAAINNFTQWLAVHFAPAGIRVNAIAPGFFSTEQNKHLLWQADGSPTARTRKIIDHTPMRRLGKPEDLHGALLWLCDAGASSFVTGTVVAVDGGFMAYSGV